MAIPQERLSNGNYVNPLVYVVSNYRKDEFGYPLNYALPTPSDYDIQTSTVVNSGRNTNGRVIGSIVRPDVTKLTLKWKYLPRDKYAELSNEFQTKGEWNATAEQWNNTENNFIHKTYLVIPELGNELVEKQMYVSDRKAKVFKRLDNGDIQGYVDISLSLVEV